MKNPKQWKGLNPDKLDDAVLAMLSLVILDDDIGNRPGIQAEDGFDLETLARLYRKGYLATHPRIPPVYALWLTRKGARRARELFRQMFCAVKGGDVVEPIPRTKAGASPVSWLALDMRVEALERRPRVRKPKGCRFIQSIGYIPTDESFDLWRGGDGKTYYIRKSDSDQPWKRSAFVRLTPAEAVAWVVERCDPRMRAAFAKQLGLAQAPHVLPATQPKRGRRRAS